MPDEALSDRAELQRFLGLVMRHWNAVVHTLHSDDIFVPLLFEVTKALPEGTTGPTASLAAWDCGAKMGLNFSMIRSTRARWCPYLHLRMNIIPIRRCDPIRSR